MAGPDTQHRPAEAPPAEVNRLNWSEGRGDNPYLDPKSSSSRNRGIELLYAVGAVRPLPARPSAFLDEVGVPE